MLKRILTAVILMPLVAVAVYWGPPWLVSGLAAIVLLLALLEFFQLTSQLGLRPFRVWTMICCLALVPAQYFAASAEIHEISSHMELIRGGIGNLAWLEILFLVFLFGAAIIGVVSRTALADVLPGVAASSAALIFIALPFSYFVRLDARPRGGPILVLFTLVLIWIGDSAAYFVGKSIGRIKMAPALSPQKTWEGAVGNVLGSLVVGFCFARWQGGDTAAWLIVAALANIAGQLGDLLESAYKRGAGVKDSGTMLPGHGGMLDRIDSLILAAPVVWLAASWLFPPRF